MYISNYESDIPYRNGSSSSFETTYSSSYKSAVASNNAFPEYPSLPRRHRTSSLARPLPVGPSGTHDLSLSRSPPFSATPGTLRNGFRSGAYNVSGASQRNGISLHLTPYASSLSSVPGGDSGGGLNEGSGTPSSSSSIRRHNSQAELNLRIGASSSKLPSRPSGYHYNSAASDHHFSSTTSAVQGRYGANGSFSYDRSRFGASSIGSPQVGRLASQFDRAMISSRDVFGNVIGSSSSSTGISSGVGELSRSRTFALTGGVGVDAMSSQFTAAAGRRPVNSFSYDLGNLSSSGSNSSTSPSFSNGVGGFDANGSAIATGRPPRPVRSSTADYDNANTVMDEKRQHRVTTMSNGHCATANGEHFASGGNAEVGRRLAAAPPPPPSVMPGATIVSVTADKSPPVIRHVPINVLKSPPKTPLLSAADELEVAVVAVSLSSKPPPPPPPPVAMNGVGKMNGEAAVGVSSTTASYNRKEPRIIGPSAAFTVSRQSSSNSLITNSSKLSNSDDVSATCMPGGSRPPLPKVVKDSEDSGDEPDTENFPIRLPSKIGLVGLKNLGNTCFMSSVIQCLSNTRPLLEYCIQTNHCLNDVNNNCTSRMKGALMKVFCDLLSELWETRQESYVSPDQFKYQLSKFAPRFTGYNQSVNQIVPKIQAQEEKNQQDAQEFLRYLLQGLHEDINRVRGRTPITGEISDQLPNAQKAIEAWKRYLTIDDSKIVDIFVGQLKSELCCSTCNYVSVTFDPFWDLSLPIPSPGYSSNRSSVTLYDCLDVFTKEEVLDGEERPTCDKCKARRRCLKQFSVQRFPPILVLHLKRFSGERFRCRLSTLIEFPVRELDLSKYAATKTAPGSAVYNLYAVSNHSGTPTYGHYTAYCKNPISGQWFLYDDTRVVSVSEKSVVSSEAYVLFYEQVPTGQTTG